MAIPKAAKEPVSPVLSQPVKILTGSDSEGILELIRRQVTGRAHSIFQESGRQQGNDDANWLKAESEILQYGLETRESGSWFQVNAIIPEAAAEGIQVFLDPHRVVVHSAKSDETRDGQSGKTDIVQPKLFLIADFTPEVDPSTASASFKEQKLTLMVKKRYPAGSWA